MATKPTLCDQGDEGGALWSSENPKDPQDKPAGLEVLTTPRKTWGGFLRPRFGLRWLFVLFLLTADYCLKIRFAYEDMKLYDLTHYKTDVVTVWVPFYVHYQLSDPLTEFERSYIGAFGFYWHWGSSTTMYHLRFPTSSGVEGVKVFCGSMSSWAFAPVFRRARHSSRTEATRSG